MNIKKEIGFILFINCVLLYSLYLFYLCNVSQSTLYRTLRSNPLQSQNREHFVYNGHSSRYNYHHIYKAHILKQLLMANFIGTFHCRFFFFKVFLYQHYLIYPKYIVSLRVSLAVIESYVRFKQIHLYNMEVPNCSGIHRDTNRITCCMLHLIYIFHTFSHNALHRIRKHSLSQEIRHLRIY